jgi:AMP deaminase
MEEEEVCKLMQECLAMRLKYIFQESLHPWQDENCKADAINEGPSISDTDPFRYVPEAASPVCV